MVPGFVKSHVVPEAIMKAGLSGGEVMAIMSTSPMQFPKRNRTGVYSRFVCASCEQRFKIHDDYLIEFVRRLKEAEVVSSAASLSGAAIWKGWDSKRLLRSLLSVLYRAHLSDNEVFSRVNLGVHAGRLRQVLFASNEDSSLSPYGAALRYMPGPIGGVVVNPLRERYGGVNTYRLYLPHLTAIIKVDNRPFPHPFCVFELGAQPEVIALLAETYSPSEHEVLAKAIDLHGDRIDRLFGEGGGRVEPEVQEP